MTVQDGIKNAEEAGLDVVKGEGLAEEGVVEEVDLADGEVVGCAPVGIHLVEQVRRKRVIHRDPSRRR